MTNPIPHTKNPNALIPYPRPPCLPNPSSPTNPNITDGVNPPSALPTFFLPFSYHLRAHQRQPTPLHPRPGHDLHTHRRQPCPDMDVVHHPPLAKHVGQNRGRIRHPKRPVQRLAAGRSTCQNTPCNQWAAHHPPTPEAEREADACRWDDDIIAPRALAG